MALLRLHNGNRRHRHPAQPQRAQQFLFRQVVQRNQIPGPLYRLFQGKARLVLLRHGLLKGQLHLRLPTVFPEGEISIDIPIHICYIGNRTILG